MFGFLGSILVFHFAAAANVVLPKDCPDVCVPRQICPELPDRAVRHSICEVSQEGDLFVCCNEESILASATMEASLQENASIPSEQETTPVSPSGLGSKCPLDASQGECGLVSADRVALERWPNRASFHGLPPCSSKRQIKNFLFLSGSQVAEVYFLPTVPDPIHLCGGTLVTSRHVLTAAHCFALEDPRRPSRNNITEIRLGDRILSTDPDCSSSGQLLRCDPPVQTFKPSKITIHPDYSQTKKRVLNDIAVVELDRPAAIDAESVFPICLPCNDASKVETLSARGAILTVSGWGAVDSVIYQSDVLRYANIPLISMEECQGHFRLGTFLDRNLHICAGGTFDSCRGDSGGPLTTVDEDGVNYLVGLVSYGLSVQCEKGGIGVYTKVESLLDWVSSVIN